MRLVSVRHPGQEWHCVLVVKAWGTYVTMDYGRVALAANYFGSGAEVRGVCGEAYTQERYEKPR